MKLLALAAAAALLPAGASAKPPTSKPAAAQDVMKCKRMPVTGSLAKTKKICMSEADWRQARDDAMRLGDDKVCSGASCAGAAGPT